MQPDDVFNRGFEAVTVTLEAQLAALKDAAKIDVERAPSFWRGRASPFVDTACGIEIVLHRNQRYDLAVGRDVSEGQVITSLDFFPALLAAAAQGDIVERTLVSATTRTPVVRTYLARLPGGPVPLTRHVLLALPHASETDAIAVDRHFAPYERR